MLALIEARKGEVLSDNGKTGLVNEKMGGGGSVKRSGKMKKWIVLLCCAVFIGVFGWRYWKVNTEWPQEEGVNIPMGDTYCIDDLEVTVEGASMMSQEDSEKKVKEEHMAIVTDEIHCRLVNISLHVKNTGTTPQSSEALLGYLVTGAYHNGFILSQEEFQKFPLDPGKEVTVTGNCLLSSTGFSKSQWKHLESRKYALSLSVYPKAVMMNIAI